MSRAAVRYGKAILSLAKEQNAADAVFTEMEQITKTVQASKDLQNLLESPLVNPETKVSSLKAVFTSFGSISQGLFDALAGNKRLDLLDDVALSYVALYKQDKGSQVATVTTAVPLSGDLETKILAKVTELTGSAQVQLENIVDESIIGGFVLRVGDIQYNASVASQLSNLKRTLNDSSYVSQL